MRSIRVMKTLGAPVKVVGRAVPGLMISGLIIAGLMVSGCAGGADGGSEPSVPALSNGTVVGEATTSVVGAVSPEATSTSSPASAAKPLFDFVSGDSDAGWNVVNDTVMGGVSSGRLAVEDGVLIFSGELSLDNNGGFASVRSPSIDVRSAEVWASRSGPRIVVLGDGRTWMVEVRTDEVSGGWIATLPTSAGSTTDVVLPWTSFEPVTPFLDPRPADGPLDPRRIVSIAFYLVDGIEGPFRLGIRAID
ncbi:MAG: CIA30 family protein [Ilumatobacteraceae bacterium]